MTAPAIALRNVWKHYGDFAAVRDVTLDVPEGRILALLGRHTQPPETGERRATDPHDRFA